MKKIKTVAELHQFLNALHELPSPTVDRLIIGDPDIKVAKVATCWMPELARIKKAYELGANVVVAHEPTFYAHHDLFDTGQPKEYERLFSRTGKRAAYDAYTAAVEEKKRWIEEHGMAVIRCHDAMDHVPGFGMPYALGECMGLCEADVMKKEYGYNVYKTPAKTAGEVAKAIAAGLKSVNCPGVCLYGDPDRAVRAIGMGAGCYSDPIEYMETGADMYVALHDTVRTWVQTVFSNDSGLPLIVIDHSVSEEWGMRKLAEFIGANTDRECVFLPGSPGYAWVTGE